MATCCDLAGTRYPAQFRGEDVLPTEGLSLVPIFRGGKRDGHRQLCWEWAGNRAIRAGNLKLCWDRGVRRWELFDMVADRTESNDLAAKQPERVAELSRDWFEWARRTGVRIPEPRPNRDGEKPAPAAAAGTASTAKASVDG